MDQNQNTSPSTSDSAYDHVSTDSSSSLTSTAPESNPNTIIIVVLGVIVVVLALMYMWGSRVGTEAPLPQSLPTEVEPALEADMEVVPVSESDVVQDIERELDVSDVDSLGSELDTLEADLNTELNTAQ